MYTVRDILDSKGRTIHSVDPDTTVYEALKIMADQNIGAVLVIKDKAVLGVFSERDYARKIVLKGKSSHDSKVGEMMTDKVYYVKPATTVNDCMQLITEHRVRHLPVLDQEEVVGVISIGDVVLKTIEGQKHTISQLEDYIIGKR